TLRVAQGSEITVHVRNDADVEATVHWHGLRLENRFDGVPHETQAPIPIGGEFTYQVRFPDPGLYWYHPHVREDYGLDMGLYGNLVVVPAEPDYWAPTNREVVLTLDDVLIEDGQMVPYDIDGPSFVAMGRFGNTMLVGGETSVELSARRGEVVRLYLTNTANTRLFNVAIPGVRMKLVGGDSGRYEHEAFIDEVLIAPSERAVIDAHFDTPGPFQLLHRTPDHSYVLGTIEVGDQVVDESLVDAFETLRSWPELTRERARIEEDRRRPPDKTLAFESQMPLLYGEQEPVAAAWTCPMHPDVASAVAGTCSSCGMKLIPAAPGETQLWTCPMHPDVASAVAGTCPSCGMKLILTAAPAPTSWACPMHPEETSNESGTCARCGMQMLPASASASPGHHTAHPSHADEPDGLEWEDLMPEINRASNACNMHWKLVDRDTGKENWQIEWAFKVGDRVKIRLVNDLEQDHPMHHPFHIHGAGRFLVLSRDGQQDPNLVWKDTVLVRANETVEILLDVTNRGLWMAHCHIAEHAQSGMMFSFPVTG
ncbi:MAG TPA: heavy metal-binding domain-containing protein, partial [Acidimicrobiales bacterium]|nr:heavy metal-binding domain-containing protein [Acidimicrobiales bacterium]